MIYIILDTESGNYEGTYHTESEALAEVRDAVHRFGRASVATWGLGRKDDRGMLTALAEGEALIERAFGRTTAAME